MGFHVTRLVLQKFGYHLAPAGMVNNRNHTLHNGLNLLQLTFRKLGSLGNPLRLVSPTLIRLSDSNPTNSSLRPTIVVLLQLSRFSSFICQQQ